MCVNLSAIWTSIKEYTENVECNTLEIKIVVGLSIKLYELVSKEPYITVKFGGDIVRPQGNEEGLNSGNLSLWGFMRNNLLIVSKEKRDAFSQLLMLGCLTLIRGKNRRGSTERGSGVTQVGIRSVCHQCFCGEGRRKRNTRELCPKHTSDPVSNPLPLSKKSETHLST